MQIQVSKVDTGRFSVREEFDEEHLQEIKDSLDKDGQWNPIMVRPKENGDYELIAGHYRLQAAKELGWDEIEANVEDVDEEGGDILSLKTNLLRMGMSETEQGRVLNQAMEEHDLSQSQLAERLGKSQSWVQERVSVALNLHPEVQEALQNDEVSFVVAQVVGGLDEARQPKFLEMVQQRDISARGPAFEARRRFLNDTIYTIGYQGRDWESFAETLQNNEIDVLIDIRKSAQSQHKPEFSGDVLGDRLSEIGINYRHIPELGVDYVVRSPYIDGWMDHDCFEGWYQWSIRENEDDFDLLSFVDALEQKGKPALLCMEQYAEPMRDQDHYCHRHYLAEILQSIVETSDSGFVLPPEGETRDGRHIFPERVDL